MDWLEWVFSPEFRRYIFDHNLFFFPLIFLLRIVGLTAVELLRPARRVSYRSVLLPDFAAFFAYQYVVMPWAGQIDHMINDHVIVLKPHLPDALLGMPLYARVICYLVIGDLGQYWIHRFLHAEYIWRIHKWHHSPTYMYWLAGVRATVPQQVLVNIPHIMAFTLS